LILAIAVAQYEADEKEVVFSVDDMDIGKSAGLTRQLFLTNILYR